MKLFLKLGAASFVFGLCATPALAQSSATATATGTTTVIQPLTIDKTADLAFGSIVRPSTDASTVSMTNAADTVSATGDAVVLGGSTSRAKFTITGEGGQLFDVTVPDSFDMTLSGGSDTLTVDLTDDLAGTATLSGTLGAEGTASLNVGGSFSVAEDTPAGAYSGTFDVTVAYQ